jgi:hypothetical protein
VHRLILALLTVFLLWAEARGAEERSLTAEVGLAKEVFPGWTPIFVTVENRGGHVQAVLEASLTSSGMTAERPVILPGGSKKRFWLYLYVTPNDYTVEVTLRDGKPPVPGKTVLRVSMHVVCPGYTYSKRGNVFTVAVLSPKAGILNFLSGIQLPNKLDARVSTPSWEILPDRWIGYCGLDMLIINAYPLERLTPSQRKAITDWVRAGGRLLVSPGRDLAWFRQAFFRALLPPYSVEIRNRRRLPEFERNFGAFEEDRTFALTVLGLPGAKVLLREGDVPLHQKVRCGLGEVSVLGFDLGAMPFSIWPGRERFWPSFFAAYHVRGSTKGKNPFGGFFRYRSDRVRAKVVSLMDTSILPSLLLLALIVGAYVIAVGPVNYLILKKKGVRIYLVFTVPVLALLFSVVILGAGYLSRGGAILRQRLTILDVPEGEGVGVEKAYRSLLSQVTRRYNVEFDRDQAAVSLYRKTSDLRGSELRIREGESFSVQDHLLRPWELACYEAKAIRDLGGAVRLRAEKSFAEIENNTDLVILRGCLVKGRDAYVLSSPLRSGGRARLGREKASPEVLIRSIEGEGDPKGAEKSFEAKALEVFGYLKKSGWRKGYFIGRLERPAAKKGAADLWKPARDLALIVVRLEP